MKNILSSGFSFIEVLISLGLLSFIFIGLEGAGLYAIHSEQEAWQLAIAMNQIDGMVERLYTLTSDHGLQAKLADWNQENSLVLPHGKGVIAGHYPAYIITIYWDKSQSCQQKIML